jgi:uncharacterized membrane protein YgdD (TMEM256/DUF423 family)
MTWIRVAAWAGFLAVAIGAFGAHGLKARLEETGYAEQFRTGVNYHFFHVAALLAVGLLQIAGAKGRGLTVAPWCFLLGILLFSGSLYVMGMTGTKWLGAVTPIGGLLFLAGWISLAWVESGT